MTEHVKVFEDDNSAIYDITDDDGTVVGQVQQFKVDKNGNVPAPSKAGAAVQAERIAAVIERQDDAQAALEAVNTAEADRNGA